VNRLARAAVMMFAGAMAVRLAATGEFGNFVQQRMRWPLLLAGAVIAVLGFLEAVGADADQRRDPTSRRRAAAPRVGWLLAAPVLVLVSVAPTRLGSEAIGRVEAYQSTERQAFPPLPDGGAVDLTLLEFVDRAVWDDDRSLADRPVRLRGFVVNDERAPDGFLLTRFAVACCAADALPVQVALHGLDQPLADDTWVDVVVEWQPPDEPYDLTGLWIVDADIVDLAVLPAAPDAPYESPY
jgi:uncharacterized repeat protein (TIGR03943 family)